MTMLAVVSVLLGLLLCCGVLYLGMMVRRRLSRMEKALAHLNHHVWNSVALLPLLPESTLPPPPGGWAASTDVLAELARLVRERRPDLVVELGSGLSTVVISAALMRNGKGKLVSIDHDAGWADKTRRHVQSANLASWCEIRHAPLEDCGICPGERWYALDALGDLDAIDLVFIDGPPADFSAGIRRPAFPLLWPKLAPGGIFVIDDADRAAERSMAEDWVRDHDEATVQWLPFEKGCAVLEKRTA